MEIRIEGYKVKFGSLNLGDVYVMYGKFFMKVKQMNAGGFNVLNLADSQLGIIENLDFMVEPVESTLTITRSNKQLH